MAESINYSYIVHTDGGARGNPGPAASAFVIESSDGTLTEEGSQATEHATNNQAEYAAVELALRAIIRSELVGDILFKLDSELVVKQIRGEYKTKDVFLKAKRDEICELISRCDGKVDFVHVPRAENKEADRLVNQAIDELVEI